MTRYNILGTEVDDTSYALATQQILTWASEGTRHYVCAANVHMVMEAYDASDFRQMVNQAGLVTPDGMPLVWVMRQMGAKGQTRVYGPDLTLHVAEAAARQEIPIGLYGGTEQSLAILEANLRQQFQGLQIVYRYSPPFRPLTDEEDQRVVQEVNASGARILLVGLGCPKQERWMAEHLESIQSVMLGVGAAFDIHAGRKAQAPRWMQRAGLEWLFRLLSEPRRLWRRYIYHNPRFLFLITLQLLQK